MDPRRVGPDPTLEGSLDRRILALEPEGSIERAAVEAELQAPGPKLSLVDPRRQQLEIQRGQHRVESGATERAGEAGREVGIQAIAAEQGAEIDQSARPERTT